MVSTFLVKVEDVRVQEATHHVKLDCLNPIDADREMTDITDVDSLIAAAVADFETSSQLVCTEA